MKETSRLIEVFEAAYNGSPWLDVTIVDTLSELSASEAGKKITANQNSIWEIVNHLIAWRINVLQRMSGEIVKSPSHNYFQSVKDTSEKEWKQTLRELGNSQQQWIDFLKNLNVDDFDKVYPPNNITYYGHVLGILQHDAYHLGQIILLSKHFI